MDQTAFPTVSIFNVSCHYDFHPLPLSTFCPQALSNGHAWQVGFSVLGSVIGEVIGGSPADLAELRSGDRIITINDAPVDNESIGLALAECTAPGACIALEI
eukprot:2340435-Rhodomonas_salina.2